MSKSKRPEDLAKEYIDEAFRWVNLTGKQQELMDFEIKQAFLAGYIACLENWNPSHDEQN